jgi:hypothetical protein
MITTLLACAMLPRGLWPWSRKAAPDSAGPYGEMSVEARVTQDSSGTHIDWEHDGVTARMIDWFWSNMEKGILLWHPNEHEPLEWYVQPKHGALVGSVHIAPQTWKDGTRQNLYIKMEDLQTLPDEITGLIIYKHCFIAGGYSERTIDDGQPFAYRLHQWESADSGVIGKSSALDGTKKATPGEGMVWAEHCVEEISNWGAFLPQLYNLYRVIKNTEYNPFTDLSTERRDKAVKYRYM